MARTTIPPELVAVNAIQGTLIADNSVTAVHIATNAISGTLVADNSITSTHIAQNQVTATQIAQNTITVGQIADSAVETAKLNNDAVTQAKIADDAVGPDQLAVNAVVSASIANGTIVAADLADNAVTLAKMASLARGSIIYGDSAGDPAALSIGSNGTALVSDGTDISWGSAGETNRLPLAGGTMTGDLILKSDGGDDVINVVHSGNTAKLVSIGQSSDNSGNGVIQLRRNNGVVHSQIHSHGNTYFNGGNVGIGFASGTPFSKLHVEDTGWSSGSPYGTVAYIQGGATNDANWGHLLISQSGTTTDTGGRLAFGANGENPIAGIRTKYKGATYGDLAFSTRPSGGINTERLVITSAGNVGIGTTSPGALLEIEGDTNSDTFEHLTLRSTVDGNPSRVNMFFESGQGQLAKIEAEQKAGGSNAYGHLAFWTANAGTMTQQMMIQYNGAVGIGENDGNYEPQNSKGLHIKKGGLLYNGNFGANSSDGNAMTTESYENYWTYHGCSGASGTFTSFTLKVPNPNNGASGVAYGGFSVDLYLAGYNGKYFDVHFAGYVNGGIVLSKRAFRDSSGGASLSSGSVGVQGFYITVSSFSITHPTCYFRVNKGGDSSNANRFTNTGNITTHWQT